MPTDYNNYGYTEDEMQDRGRWTPVYSPNELNRAVYEPNEINSPVYDPNNRSTPVNYILPSDLLPSVSNQRYQPKRNGHRIPRTSRNSHNKPLHRQRGSQVSSPEDPPTNPTIADYSLASFFRLRSRKSSPDGNEKKSNFNKYLKKVVLTIVLMAYIAFFIAVIIVKSQIEDEDYWCNGDGMLIILTALGSFIFIYYKILIPLVRIVMKSVTKTESQRVEILPKLKCLNHWFFKLITYAAFIAGVLGFLVYDTSGERRRLYSLGGIIALLLFGILFSSAPRKIKWKNIIWAFGSQFIFALLVLRWPPGISFFECISGKVHTYLLFADFGSRFIYGDNLIDQQIFVFKAMSVVIFFSLCIQVLYYYGIMQFLVMKIGWFLKITVGTTACESVSAAGNMFLGQTEAPLLVKPYLNMMTKSELHAIMTGGFATISGSVMAAFISFGVSASHLVTASVMNAPAALGMSKLYRPEVEKPKAADKFFKIEKGNQVNALHAALDGVSVAIPLVANIAANLLAFIAVMAFIDAILNWMCLLVNVDDGVCSLSNGFGYAFMPIAFLMGVPWNECYRVGQLIGTKVFVNEFVAYVRLAEFIDNSFLSKRSEIIATYALCGFGNISSIGIQIGGLGSLAPDRKPDFAKLAITALVAGCSASFMTACIAGTLVSSPFQTPDEFGVFALANTTMNN